MVRLGERGFLVPSHCTKTFGVVDWSNITRYWQHRRRWYQPNHRQIGNEAIDPPLFSCANPNGCRYSDAALGLYHADVGSQLGRIARPASRNTEALNLHPSSPRFTITEEMDYSIDGEILEKVGRTTGWSGGQVVDGCVDLPSALGHTHLCQMIVAASAGEMDSGSPVFRILSGTQVELRGMLWGGWGPCRRGVDGVVRCDQFVASPLGGIRQEVGAGASLQFYPSGGGGGPPGGGCIPDPLDPKAPPICPDGAVIPHN